jgi:diguanylate cyclase (GGDEF)-like protein
VTTPPQPRPLNSPTAKAAIGSALARVAVLAAGVDVVYFLFFLVVGSPWLTWINVVSVGLYALTFMLARRQRLHAAALLIWLEAFPHAVIGTLLTGWDSGFHYLLLMFIPSVILTNSRRRALAFVVALLVFLVALDYLARTLGPLAPLSAGALIALKWLNITIFATMFSSLSIYYRQKIFQAERSLHAQATQDALTGLHNRRHFQQVAEQELVRCQRTGSSAALLIMDIDFFKTINDTYGHEVGDLVLISVARTLKQGSREMDTLARWGGEEFVLLMPGIQAAEAWAVAERFRQAVEQRPVIFAGGEILCTLSFGVTQLQAGEVLSAAVARADRALYRSKVDGKNRVSAE